MKYLCIFTSLLLLQMGSVNAQVHNELLGSWTLKIENLQHKVVTTMVIHFIDNEAPSCLSGNWKQVVVDSYESSDSELVPANEWRTN